MMKEPLAIATTTCVLFAIITGNSWTISFIILPCLLLLFMLFHLHLLLSSQHISISLSLSLVFIFLIYTKLFFNSRQFRLYLVDLFLASLFPVITSSYFNRPFIHSEKLVRQFVCHKSGPKCILSLQLLTS